jgi:hypothetical protein
MAVRMRLGRNPWLATARWSMTIGQLLVCVLIAFALVRYTNYTEYAIHVDGMENIANAFFVSQGWRAYSDFGNNHLPGVYLYLAPFLQWFGFRSGFQGPEFLERIMLAGSFATVLFQVALFTLALRLCAVRALPATFVIAALSVWLYGSWDVHVPMSETYCIGLYALWTVLVHQAVLAPSARRRFVAAFWLLPLGAVATWFGLTQVFANALGVVFGAAAMRAAGFGVAADGRVRLHLIAGAALCLALLAATLWYSDTAGLLFYNLEVNLHVNRPALAGQFAEIGRWHFERFAELPVLKGLPLLLLMVTVIALTLVRQGRSRRRIAVFAAVVVAGAILTLWRDARGFHAASILGIQLGLMFLLAGLLRRAARRWRMPAVLTRFGREALYLCLGLVLVATALFSSDRRALLTRADPPSQRLPEFDGVCRFAQDADCACLRVSHVDPTFFLRHDVRPCPGYGFWTTLQRDYPPLRDEYLREVESRRIAYVIFDPLQHHASFSQEIADAIERGHACRDVRPHPSIKRDFRLCLPPARR